MRMSRLTICFSLFIIISASFMAQLMRFIKHYIKDSGLLLIIGLALLIPVLLFAVTLYRNRVSLTKAVFLLAGISVALALVWRIPMAVERIHIAEYGILGWLLGRDIILKDRSVKAILAACLLALAVGAADEAFQAVLPYRVFDLRDIAFNGLGGACGIILFRQAAPPAG